MIFHPAVHASRADFKLFFRIVIFRPFTGEVVLGKVKSSDEKSIRSLSLSFLSSTICGSTRRNSFPRFFR